MSLLCELAFLPQACCAQGHLAHGLLNSENLAISKRHMSRLHCACLYAGQTTKRQLLIVINFRGMARCKYLCSTVHVY